MLPQEVAGLGPELLHELLLPLADLLLLFIGMITII